MANEITFIKGQGGLGRPLAGEDHVSGLLLYSDTLPSGFGTSDRIKQVLSLEQAEALGITNTHIGETKATGTITVTGAGAENDIIVIKVNNGSETVTIGTATVPATPTTTTVAAAIAAAINLGTLTHGYSASPAVAVVTLTAPAGTGQGANSYVISDTITGTATVTLVQFSSGVGSIIDVMHYQVAEYFRLQPKGDLFIGIYATAGYATFSALTTIQDFASGKIRQFGVWVHSAAFATSQVTTLQSVAATNETNKKPFNVIYQGDFTGVSDLTTLADLRTLLAPKVSVTIGQDNSLTGKAVYNAFGKSVGCLGTTLGAVAFASVSEDIAWPEKFNIATTAEYDSLAYANGDLYDAQTDNLHDAIDAKGYIALKKHIGLNGSYFNDSHTSVAVTSDYAYIENGRTIDKAIRNNRTFLLPALASPIKVNIDGTLTEDVIAYFETLCKRALEQMERDDELSNFNVIINPAQDVLSTSELIITIELLPIGVARQIRVNIGFVLSITT